MLPPLKHRLVIGLALVLGALCWILALGPLRAADGSAGISLMDARCGTTLAVVLVVLAGLPAFGAGLLAASTGNPLAGAFTLAGALIPLASLGGPITGYYFRSPLPSVFKPLAVEAAVWLILMGTAFVVIDRLRKSVRPRLENLVVKRHLGARIEFGVPGGTSLLAGLITAVGGALLCNILVQSPDCGQVTGGLLIGFALAAMIAQSVVPQHNPLVILLSPMLVALVSYIWAGRIYTTPDSLLADLYRGDLLNLVLALPVHYASAGVAGAAAGVGLAQTMEHTRRTTVAAAA